MLSLNGMCPRLIICVVAVCTTTGVGMAVDTNMTRACPADYDYYQHRHACYKHFYTQARNWSYAREHCQSEGADLAIVPDADTADFITQLVARTHSNSTQIWIGLFEVVDGLWHRWVDGNSPDYTTVWWEGEPSNDVIDGEDCVQQRIIVTSGSTETGMNDVICSAFDSYVCERSPDIHPSCPSGYTSYSENRKCVRVEHDLDLTWDDARDLCQREGGDLAVILDDAYNSFIKSLLEDDHRYWIGLTYSTSAGFYWIDGTLLRNSYKQWAANQPDVEVYEVRGEISIIRRFDGWNDYPTGTRIKAVCEQDFYEPVHCPGDGWISNARNKQCYKVHANATTFQEAKDRCREEEGSDLAIITDQQTTGYILKLIPEHGPQCWVVTSTWSTDNACLGDLLQTDDPQTTQDSCDAHHLSVCERHSLRKYPVMECPHGYTTYVTTTTGWQITCVMAEREKTQKKTWADARLECKKTGGDLFRYDHSQTDLNDFIRLNLLLSGEWYWIRSQCRAFQNGVGNEEHYCTKKYRYICRHWGNVQTTVKLVDLQDFVGDILYDVSSEHTPASISDVCSVSADENDVPTDSNSWVRTATLAVVTTENELQSTFMEDQIAQCTVYSPSNQSEECCAQVTFSIEDNSTHFHQQQPNMTFPMDKLSCLCSDDYPVEESIELLRNLTTPENGATAPHNLCPCRCDSVGTNFNPSPQELADILFKIQRDLEVETDELSSTRNKKVSAGDSRAESQAMGYMGVVLSLVPIGLLVVMDVSRVLGPRSCTQDRAGPHISGTA